MDDCLFCKIVAGELPATEVMRTERAVAFRDIDAQAPTHVLVVPTEHIENASVLGPEHAEILGRIYEMANAVARSEGLDNGYRLIMNVGADAGNTVPHLHLHVLGGHKLD